MAPDQNPLINIDLQPAADVVNNLINKISSAVGWVVTHDTPNKHAVNTYIAEIEKSDLDPLIKAAKISSAKRDIKQYTNQHKIVCGAAPLLSQNSHPEDLSDDWINMFMDRARLVSNEKMQTIWSRILAQESNSPGTCPLQLLHILSILSKQLANKFLILCGFTFSLSSRDTHSSIPEESLMIDFDNLDYYRTYGLTFEDFQDLQSIGLLSISDSGITTTFSPSAGDPDILHYEISIANRPTFNLEIAVNNSLNTGAVLLTYCGQALAKILTPTTPPDFAAFCFNIWNSSDKNYSISWINAPE